MVGSGFLPPYIYTISFVEAISVTLMGSSIWLIVGSTSVHWTYLVIYLTVNGICPCFITGETSAKRDRAVEGKVATPSSEKEKGKRKLIQYLVNKFNIF